MLLGPILWVGFTWSLQTEPALPRPDRVCLAPCRGTYLHGRFSHQHLLSCYGVGDAYRLLSPIAATVIRCLPPFARQKKFIYLYRPTE
jgi:hypothetical protein